MSGGYDSVACCIKLLDEGHTVMGLFFNLSQPYLEQERQAVQYASEFLTTRYNNWLGFTTALAPMKLQTSSDDTPSEYIPVRNFVFSALSANFAIAEGYVAVAVGNKTTTVRPNDPYSFRDCSIEFYSMMQNAVAFCSEGDTEIQFLMPLINNNVALTKAEVVGIILNSGMDIRKLWSCYKNMDTPCGECHDCLEARKAFDNTGYDYSDFFINNLAA